MGLYTTAEYYVNTLLFIHILHCMMFGFRYFLSHVLLLVSVFFICMKLTLACGVAELQQTACLSTISHSI